MLSTPPLINIHPYTLESLFGLINSASLSMSNFAGVSWPAANRAIFIPFTLMQRIVAKRLWVHNSSSVSGNVDMGIYDASGKRLVSIGSTAQSGTSTLQLFDIADTVLDPGTFFIGLALDGTPPIFRLFNAYNAIDFGVMGVYQMASAFPLPNPATFATPSNAYLPLCGLSTRDLV